MRTVNYRCSLRCKQPFCDNSHIGTKFKPIVFEIKKDNTM